MAEVVLGDSGKVKGEGEREGEVLDDGDVR